MPRIFNYGSLNIDHVYQVERIARPGETVASHGFFQGAGGKGFNQSVALARAGAAVVHLGRFGNGAAWLRERLATEGVDVAHLLEVALPAGSAVIQVDPQGQNAIVLHPGANHALRAEELPELLETALPGDWFLTQNETACVPEALTAASTRGLIVCFNPAPVDTSLLANIPWAALDWLIVNETEGAFLCGKESAPPEAVLRGLRPLAPKANLILTLGAEGVWCETPAGTRHTARPPRVQAVDTTAAGDAFIGYLLATQMAGLPLETSLQQASQAAALSVTRRGAADAIPLLAELIIEDS